MTRCLRCGGPTIYDSGFRQECRTRGCVNFRTPAVPDATAAAVKRAVPDLSLEDCDHAATALRNGLAFVSLHFVLTPCPVLLSGIRITRRGDCLFCDDRSEGLAQNPGWVEFRRAVGSYVYIPASVAADESGG